MNIGTRFKKLVVLDLLLPLPGKKQFRAKVRCDCGVETVVQKGNLQQGTTRSCGCLRVSAVRAANTKHGHSRTRAKGPSPEYSTWGSMLARCYNKKHTAFKNYGGRGITVCSRWRKSFINFLEDMGTRPKKQSIDRINNDGNYTLLNCRWATAKQQRANVRLFNSGATYV